MTAMGTCAIVLGATRVSARDAVLDPGNERVLRVGETLRYDSGLKITFLAVRNDSRCPINARCTWAGDAEVVLRVKAGNQAARTVSIHTNLKPRKVVIPANVFAPGMTGISKSYIIGIAELTPQPEAGKKTLQSDHRLKLQISVAQ